MARVSMKKRFSFFDVAFCVLLAVFVITALFSFCSFKGTGKSFTYQADKEYTAAFEVKGATTAKVKTVCVNVGAAHVKVGENVIVSIRRSADKGSRPTVKFGSEQTVGNIYSQDKKGESGKLFNWLTFEVASEKTTGILSVSANKNIEINEIVCFDEDGTQIPLTVSKKYTTGYSDAKNAVDRQNSYVGKTSIKYLITEEEAYTLTAVRNMMLGDKYADGSVYNVDGRFGAISTALYLPAVALFGPSTGAIRVTSLFYTALALVFLYLFAKLLFKDDKSAFILSLFAVLGGLFITSGVLGVPHALIAFSLIASLYFIYRFFSQGVSSQNPAKSGLSVLYSGLFSALALAVDITCIFPVLGVVALFVFGLRRQQAAYALAVEKTPENEKKEEIAAKEKGVYEYKTKVCIGYAVLSFIVGFFFLLLLGTLFAYSAYVRAFDDPAAPSLGFASLLLKSVKTAAGANITSYTYHNATVAAGWLIPWKAATFFFGGKTYQTWSAFINPALSIAALASLLFCGVAVAVDFKNKQSSKAALRVRRIFFVFLFGTLLTAVGALFTKHLSTAFALSFLPFFLGFIPLAIKIAEEKSGKLASILLCVVAAIALLCFVFAIPSLFGFEIPANMAKLFTWMTPRANGFFR